MNEQENKQLNPEEMSPEILERYNIYVDKPNKNKPKLRKFIILTVILLLSSLAVLSIKNTWFLEDTKDIVGDLSDAFIVPGVMFIGSALLVICSNGGAFDMMVYGVSAALGAMFKKDVKDRKYQNFGDYRLAKAEHPGKYKHLLYFGLVYFAIGVIIYLIYTCL